MKLSKTAVGRIAGAAKLSWAVLIGLGCAQGEDLSSAPKDGGSRGGGTGFGVGGSTGSAGTGTGGSSSAGTGGAFIGAGGSTNTGGSTGSGGSLGQGGGVFIGAGGGSSGTGGFLGIGGSTPVSDASGAGGGGAISDGPVSMGLTAATTFQQFTSLNFIVTITNNGQDMIPVKDLKVRYYFSDDSFLDPTTVQSEINFDSAAWQTGSSTPQNGNYYKQISCTAQLVQLPATQANFSASSYFEMGCSDAAFDYVLGPLDYEKIPFRLQGPSELPSDDYSYAAAVEGGPMATVNDHVIVLQAGSVAWGVLPP